jgi:hypothetical protein
MSSRLAVIIVTALFAATGCSTAIALTDKGRLVHVSSDAELPMGCNLIGDIPIGLEADAARPRTEDELVILMRNKAGAQGGTHVIVDSKDQRGETEEGRRWVGRGRGYNCPPSTADVTGPSEDGDDDTVYEDEEGEGEEGEGAESEEAEDEEAEGGGEELNDEDLL